MEENLVKPTSTSLSVVDKRPQRPGGCVGMFYQLLDWNRRLAKKKLFSKKLLPPARAKRAAKKFGGDDKLPTAKLLLIAEENRGGFPNAKKSGIDIADNAANGETYREMRSPSLVARLMGLESMPALRRENPKDSLNSEYGHGRTGETDGKFRCSKQVGCDKDEFYLGKGDGKVETRPQKLQKTGVSERRPVTRFGAEVLLVRSTLSQSRKHQPKIVSPVKSPRVGRNASRLMGAATKILEPGMQASNRAKCALTYSPAIRVTSSDEDVKRSQSIQPVENAEQHKYYASHSKPLKGQPPCKSCGNWLDVVDSRSVAGECVMGMTSSTLGLGSAPPLRPKVKQPGSSSLQERGGGTSIHQGNRQKSKSTTEINCAFQEYRDQYHSSSHQMRSENDVAPSTAQNSRTKRQSQMLPMDRSSTKSKLNSINNRSDAFAVNSSYGIKDCVARNQNVVRRVKPGLPSKSSNNCKNNRERNALKKNDDSLSKLRGSVRKKRLMIGMTEVENASLSSVSFRKSRDIGNDVSNRKCPGTNSCSTEQNCVKRKVPIVVKRDAANSPKDTGVISFTFNSPMRHKTDSLSPTITKEKTRCHAKFANTNSSHKNLTLDTQTGKSSSRAASPMKGDAIGALLEKKLKELICHDRDELETGDGLPGRSTAAILEELIFALTAEKPISMDDRDNYSIGLSNDDSSSYASQAPSDDIISEYPTGKQNGQEVPKSCMSFSGFPLGVDGEHDSPGSILDASFSNGSYFSESLNGYTGHKLQSEESMEDSYSQPQPSEYDAEISDCATSTSKRVADSFDSTYSDQKDEGFVPDKLNYALKVILNVDNQHESAINDTHSMKDIPVATLLDKLESLLLTPQTATNSKMSFMGTTEESQQSRFLLDCLVEFLDSRYTLYFKSRLKAWPIPPLQITEESLTWEVHEAIQKWADVAVKSLDEILEGEIYHFNWMDFKIESFEIGEEIEYDILEVLVSEVVTDLEQWEICRS